MTSGLDDGSRPSARIRGPLTAELADIRSPVRRFLDDRFSSGLREVQRRYRLAAPGLVVPPADREEANPGTLGGAADWLLRFLLHPAPSLELAITGAGFFGARSGMVAALADIAGSLGMSSAAATSAAGTGFDGPIGGSAADPELLDRACWALSLLTELFRAGAVVATSSPLSRFRRGGASAAALLDLAPPVALDQLAAFRYVYETTLIPQLAGRVGRWHLGPAFTGSELMRADADLIAAGLLIDLKTAAARPSLGVREAFQVIGYALLDFDDAYQLTDVGIFSARYAYLARWDLPALLDELAGQPASLADTREEFRQLLLAS